MNPSFQILHPLVFRAARSCCLIGQEAPLQTPQIQKHEITFNIRYLINNHTSCSHLSTKNNKSIEDLETDNVWGPCDVVSEGEFPGAGVVVVLLLDDVWVGVNREVSFLQVWGRLTVSLGAAGGLRLPAHFLIDGGVRLQGGGMTRLDLRHIK